MSLRNKMDGIMDFINIMNFINWHGHTDASNHNNRDSIINAEQMIDVALALGHSGVGISDQTVLSNHVKAIKYLNKLRTEVNDKFFTIMLLYMII